MGGMLNQLNKLGPSMTPARDLAAEKIKAVHNESDITVFTGAQVTDVQGFIGNFVVDIETETGAKKIDIGVIIVAIGSRVFVPEGLFGYDGKTDHYPVRTGKNPEERVGPRHSKCGHDSMRGQPKRSASFLRKVCCQTAVKNAMLIREQNPNSKVSILYRDMQMYGVENEEMFRDSKAKGVRYLNYDPSRPPEVNSDAVKVYHSLMGRDMSLNADMVVLSTPVIANDDAEEISKLLRVPINETASFSKAYVKLKPLDFATDGIYLAGSDRFPPIFERWWPRAWSCIQGFHSPVQRFGGGGTHHLRFGGRGCVSRVRPVRRPLSLRSAGNSKNGKRTESSCH